MFSRSHPLNKDHHVNNANVNKIQLKKEKHKHVIKEKHENLWESHKKAINKAIKKGHQHGCHPAPHSPRLARLVLGQVLGSAADFAGAAAARPGRWDLPLGIQWLLVGGLDHELYLSIQLGIS